MPRGRVSPITSRPEDARAFLEEAGLDVDAFAKEIDGRFMAAFVRASKPA
jgi:arsenite methyltransferase